MSTNRKPPDEERDRYPDEPEPEAIPPPEMGYLAGGGVRTVKAYDQHVTDAARRAVQLLAEHDDAVAAGRAEPSDPFHAVTHATRRAWLRALAVSGNKSRAARAVGISRWTPYSDPWQNDPDFARLLPLAERLGADMLEAEAQRRAVEGVPTPVGWYRGKPGGYVLEYSDALLQTLLKAQIPDRYGDRLKVTGTLAGLDLSKLTDEQLKRIRDGEHPLTVLAADQRRALPAPE